MGSRSKFSTIDHPLLIGRALSRPHSRTSVASGMLWFLLRAVFTCERESEISLQGAYNGNMIIIMKWIGEWKSHRDKSQNPMGINGVIMDYNRGIPVSNGHIMGISPTSWVYRTPDSDWFQGPRWISWGKPMVSGTDWLEIPTIYKA